MILLKFGWILIIVTLTAAGIGTGHAATSRWGADYFPNVPLTTHEGETVHFFDDLIKDRVVVINFIYTSCPDTCPLETAQLTRVQRILGDRLGKDVFFYSITIDPDTDTVDVLNSYREKFGARWTFLTGKRQDIISLRRKLGLYIEDIQDGSNNHNVNMIIGNQATGRWMKRSPFENPHVLADQIGNWLSGWKAPQHIKDFANAPELRAISDGEKLYRTRCASCHSIDGSSDTAIGPDLLGVTDKRDRHWLVNWLRAPDKMLADKDPIAIDLYKKFNEVTMPNMRLSQVDIQDLITYMHKESLRQSAGQVSERVKAGDAHAHGNPMQDNNNAANAHKTVAIENQTHAHNAGQSSGTDVVAVMDTWIRVALPASSANAGYMTLVNVDSKDVTLINVESEAFGSVGFHEMATVDGMMEMRELDRIVVPAGGRVQFAPGGMHLMLEQPRVSVDRGNTVALTLIFESGRKQTVTVSVEDR